MFDEDDLPKSEYELQRLKNIEEFAKFMAEDDNSEESIKARADIEELTHELNERKKLVPRRRKVKNTKGDATFTFHGHIPTQRRRSARLAKIPVEELMQYTEEDDKEETPRTTPPKQKRKSNRRSKARPVPVLPVECVTNEMLDNIAVFSTNKQYSENGTTCHQCRQKTNDVKTVCRSGVCKGLRGYFCGPCLRNRYAESVAEALLDPNWVCPACRDLCNCSFCQIGRGEAPTGVLAPIAIQQGYASVSHLLQDMQKKKIISRGKRRRVIEDAEPCLLGFNGNGQHVDDTEPCLPGFKGNGECVEDAEPGLLGFKENGEYVLA